MAPVRQPKNYVVVGVPTYKRPEDLMECLASIGRQVDCEEHWDRTVIVVDNDPAGSARLVAQQVASRAHLQLVYHVEPAPGLSPVRNRCVELARDYEFLAFIDDDERAHPRWLAGLLSTQRRYDADLTGGPVFPLFTGFVPGWARSSGVYERSNPGPGSTDRTLGTGNLLIRLAIVQQLGTLFDASYALTGGEDRHLTKRARAAGLSLVWAPEAGADERVLPDRMTLRWVARRGFRVGTTTARVDLELGLQGKVQLIAGGVVRLLAHTVLGAGATIVLRPGRSVWHLRGAANAAGLLAGTAGAVFHEYAIHSQ